MAIGTALQALARRVKGTIIMQIPRTGPPSIVVLDATTRRSHVYDADVTQFPVEEGLSFGTDNVRKLPSPFRASGVLTDTPIQYFSLVPAVPGSAQTRFQQLLRMHEEGEPCQVLTDLGPWSNVILKTIAVDEDESTGDAIFVDLAFEEARILRFATLPVDFDFDAALLGAAGTPDQGTQSGLDIEQFITPFTGGG